MSFQCRHGDAACAPPGAAEGPELQIARLENVPNLLRHGMPLHRLDQHGAALPAADAFGGDAALEAEPFHRIDEMQHDAIAAGADRMAEPDRAAVDIELVALDRAGGPVEMQHLAAERVVLPGRQAGQHLRGERLVELPQLDIVEREPLPAQDRGRAQHRAQAP